MDCSPPGSFVRGIFQVRNTGVGGHFHLQGIPPNWPMDQTHVSWVSCTGRQILYHCTTWYTDLVLKPTHTWNKKASIQIRYSNFTRGFPGGSDGKESACNMGDLRSFPGLGRSPGVGHGNPLQYSCLEDPHGQRSLASPSPWGHRKSDTTEQLSTAKLY